MTLAAADNVPPRITHLKRDDTHRLIPARYAEERTVLARIANTDDQVQDLFELDSVTNDRLLGESNLLPGVTVHELVFGVPHYHIINAAFTHAHPQGSRFGDPDRGVWYAAFELATSQAEVGYHFGQALREINWAEEEIAIYREFLADFRAAFHDIRRDTKYASALNPNSYAASQRLGRELLHRGSAGIVYPSVRHRGGTCIACFRPALVTNVREGVTVTVTFANANARPEFRVMRSKQRG